MGPLDGGISQAGAAAPLTLRTLGEAGLYASGAREPLLGPGKPLAVLIYLALTPGRRISREFLLDLLWADLEGDRARNALRQVLFHLRKLLGSDTLRGSEELELVRPIDTDRDRFLAAIERGDLEGAVDARGGPFLPAFGVPGGTRFEQWASLERNRLEAAYLRTAELLVRRQLNQSRFREAQRLARRVRGDAPHAEAAWRLVLDTVVAAGDFVSAGTEADALEDWAASEELVLEPASRQAIARARQVAPATGEASADRELVAELTGREREFAAITGAWDCARAGPARHLHVTGPAGIGKTRLVKDAAARLRAGGATVVEVRAVPGDRNVPYAFAGDLVMALAPLPGAAGVAPASAAALVALNPAVSSWVAGQPDAATGDEALRRRIHALTDLLFSVADEQPFVLVIDDVHWIDDHSWAVLEGLCRRLGGAAVLCLTAGRSDRVMRGDAITPLPLAPLTLAQTADLVSTLGAVPDGATWDGDFVTGVYEATRGSPLLIIETLRLAIEQGVLTLEAGQWICLDASRLGSLLRTGEALRQRVRSLPADQGWALGLLAVAGAPLPAEWLAADGNCPAALVTETLEALERQGLATRVGALWLAAHDEIAEAGRIALGADSQRAAERTIGELVIRDAGSDPRALLRGLQHLVAAGEMDRVALEFRRYAQSARAAGDRRPFRVLAAEVLGIDAASPRVAALPDALPYHWRVGLWSRARQGVAAALVVLAGGAYGLAWFLSGREDRTLQRIVYLDSTRSTSAVAVRPQDFDGRSLPLVLSRADTRLVEAALAFPERAPAVSPDGRSVAWNQNAGDSTTLDIWLSTSARVRRLTRQAHDDLVTGWLPDGSGLVGLSARWSSPAGEGYDVAVFDTATGTARQVTSGPEHDQSPFVSPDGTRIAFIRESDDGPPRLCMTTFDSLDAPECRLVGGQPLGQFFGWSGPAELIVTLDSAGTRPLIRYDWERNERTLLLGPYVYRAQLSPDRQWVLGAARLEGVRGVRDWILPVAQPARARYVESSTAWADRVRWWEGPSEESGLIDRIDFSDSSRTLLLGLGTQLDIQAIARTGAAIPLHAPVRWSTGDTLIATIGSGGNVHPRALGSVTIIASLAGWRTVRGQFTVRGEPAQTVFTERWDDRWPDRWITFGEPRPEVTSGPGSARALWNRGDGVYPSMVVQRRSFSAKHGLGVEIRLSTPITRADRQRARTALVAGIDTTELQQADQAGGPPAVSWPDASCGAGFPGAAGGWGRQRLAVVGGISPLLDLGGDAEAMRSGEWWTLRLQILPDGRCGIAINGRVVWLSPERVPLDGEFRLRLGDESAGARLLHGSLDVWTGVRSDIEWSAGPGG